jgi:hypothetical protein
MHQQSPGEAREQIVDTMIDLSRLSSLQRVIIAGSDGLEISLALRRRGFFRLAMASTSRVPQGHHTVGFVAGRHSLQALETTLAQISRFLNTTASIAVAIDTQGDGNCLKISKCLDQLGFRIEALVRFHSCSVMSAFRPGLCQIVRAA